MGCDIHLYIEYRSKKVEHDGVKDSWLDFGGRINPGRNYALFALMAGVRDYTNKIQLMVPPRGMPEDPAYTSRNDNQIYISENEFSGERTVTMERAKGWVERGNSQFIFGKSGDQDKPIWVTDPDAHTHSWLTTGEFETIFNKYLELESGWHKERIDEHNKYIKENDIKNDSWTFDPPSMNIGPEYQAVLASMKRFEELGYDARIVFWFDN